jgi:hypothetical protein
MLLMGEMFQIALYTIFINLRRSRLTKLNEERAGDVLMVANFFEPGDVDPGEEAFSICSGSATQGSSGSTSPESL